MQPENLNTIEETAAKLKIDRREIHRLIARGALRAKSHKLRGEGLRNRKPLVTDSEIARYQDEEMIEASGGSVPKKMRQQRGKLSGVVQFV